MPPRHETALYNQDAPNLLRFQLTTNLWHLISVSIGHGIKQFGINGRRNSYPHHSSYTTGLDFKPHHRRKLDNMGLQFPTPIENFTKGGWAL